MATIEYLHVCALAFADETGKQCIIGIFDVIGVLAFPAVHPSLSIATRFRGKPNESIPLKVELLPPTGSTIFTIESDFKLGEEGHSFLQINLQGLQFPKPGLYTFKISSAGRTLTTHPLELRQTSQGGPPAVPSKQVH